MSKVKPTYPLSCQDLRVHARDLTGNACVWDIDKTYLATAFSSLRGLAKIPLEFAVDKHAIPGMPEVLRGLRHGPGPAYACTPLYFISASPAQMRGVIERRMLLDGVECDGMILKDWTQALRGLGFHRLFDQLAFKLCALLTGRRLRPRCKEYLFGDDAERDAEAFVLYAQLLDGSLSRSQVERALIDKAMARHDRHCVLHLVEGLPRSCGSVERAFIHLEKNSPPAAFATYGSMVVPVTDAFQLSLALMELGLVSSTTVEKTRGAKRRAGSTSEQLESACEDARARGLISVPKLNRLVEGWQRPELCQAEAEPSQGT